MSGVLNLGKAALCFGLLMISGPIVWGAPQAANAISTPDQFKDEFQTAPCKNSDRQDAVKSLFEKMGATAPAEITLENYKRVENVVTVSDEVVRATTANGWTIADNSLFLVSTPV